MTSIADATASAGATLSDWPALPVAPLVRRLRDMALRALQPMYRADRGLFAFTVRVGSSRTAPEGVSARYTAIALIGLANEDAASASRILGGQTPAAACDRLVAHLLNGGPGIGDVALACWAAGATASAERTPILERLLSLRPDATPCATVELSWALSALCRETGGAARAMRERVASRLMAAFRPAADGFPHTIGVERRFRTHVACFADQIYPVLALSQYAALAGDRRAIELARRTAARISALQGDAGQWWWHYHADAGSLVEGYPVYAVHQHAMAPMAFVALERVAPSPVVGPILRGLEWLQHSPELDGGSLIDDARAIIWRKVGRREPPKAARYLQAALTYVRPGAEWPFLDRVFPPGAVDFECRPYELGWLLFAWPRPIGEVRHR